VIALPSWLRPRLPFGGEKLSDVRRITDQPFRSIWIEADSPSTIGREIEAKGGIALQNNAERHVWLIGRYLITVVPHPRFGNTSHSFSESEREHKRLKAWLTNVGLALIIIMFAFFFIGTLIFMATHP